MINIENQLTRVYVYSDVNKELLEGILIDQYKDQYQIRTNKGEKIYAKKWSVMSKENYDKSRKQDFGSEEFNDIGDDR